MNILISGAGPAGLTTAYWLKKYGFNPTIVERAPALLTGGYKIDVRGSALQVLKRMGIYEAVLAAKTDMQYALLIDKDGKEISKMSGDAFGHRVDQDVEIIRGTLCEILLQNIPDVEILFGDSIQQLSQSPDGIKVKFQNHSAREFDLIIGADGVHSNVRRQVFGAEENFLHDLGLYLCVFTTPNYLNLDRAEMQYAELGKVAAIWSSRGENNMRVCFAFTSSLTDTDLKDRIRQEQTIKNIYADLGWEIPRFLQMMPDATDYYFDTAAQIHMEHWSRDRCVLVGDAGYCASPMSGQGTSLALIGAYVLAGELKEANGNYQLAFERYEQALRPFIKINQELGITAANLMRSRGKKNLLTWLLNQLMRFVPGRLITFLINQSTRRINQAANSITLKVY